MELFARLFAGLRGLVYHCFDRRVIHGYLSGLSRPPQGVYGFRPVVGVPEITQEVLSRRTADDQPWVEAFAGNPDLPLAWAEKGVRQRAELRPHRRDFGLKKGWEHRAEVHPAFLTVLDRFAPGQASALHVHVESPCFQRLAQPVPPGATRLPGLKIQDTPVVRWLAVLLHGSTPVGGWSTAALHPAVLTTSALSGEPYPLPPLRYDWRKLRGHGLRERHGPRYAYRLTAQGLKVARLFTLFPQRICGPLANSLFPHRPDPTVRPQSKLQAAYHKADASLQQIIQLVQAA